MTGIAMKTDKALREEAVDWFLQQRDRPDDPTLEANLASWLARDARHERAFARVRCLMGDAGALLAQDPQFLLRAAQKRGPRKGGMAAAAIAGIALLGAVHFADIPMRLRSDYMSNTAERRVITTPDGSTITLNANSAIALHFSDRERRVELLRGQIFAQVAPDKQRPFSVAAEGGTTTALGTAFDVNMRDGETSVSVLEHSVLVKTDAQTAGNRVSENQQVNYTPDGRIGDIQPIDPSSIAAWRQGRFVFEDKPLSDVIEAFERYIPGHIIVTRNQLRETRLSGNFDLSDPRTALADLAAALEITVVKVGPYLTVLY